MNTSALGPAKSCLSELGHNTVIEGFDVVRLLAVVDAEAGVNCGVCAVEQLSASCCLRKSPGKSFGASRLRNTGVPKLVPKLKLNCPLITVVGFVFLPS